MTKPPHILTAAPAAGVRLDAAALDLLAPFHLLLDEEGRVLSAGRSLQKIFAERAQVGAQFFDLFDVARPRNVASIDALRENAARKLMLLARLATPVAMRGVAARIAETDHLLLDMSVAIKNDDALETLDLIASDFSPADTTVDLLYVVSAQKQLLADTHVLMTKLQEAKAGAEQIARVDSLTGALNRRAITSKLSASVARLLEGGAPFALLHIDLDRFKYVNDQFGHAAGDAALEFATAAVRREIRENDDFGRIGGDEFIVILNGLSDRARVQAVSQRIVDAVRRPFSFAGREIKLGASIGAVIADPQRRATAEQIMADSDAALYTAKDLGRSRCVIFDDAMRARLDASSELAREIEAALDANEFTPFFQPQLEAATGAIIGFEALARWRRADGLVVEPAAFLSVAEAHRLTQRIDDVVMSAAFNKGRRITEAGLFDGVVSVNVSTARLGEPELVDRIAALAAAARFPHDAIGVEIREAALHSEASIATEETIRQLAARGFRVRIDDFGAGGGSVATLRSYPIDQIKIDRSLICGVDQDDALQRTTQALIDVARSLGVEALAAGVETEGEEAWLRQAGCSALQGFAIARPMPPRALRAWLNERRRQEPAAREIGT